MITSPCFDDATHARLGGLFTLGCTVSVSARLSQSEKRAMIEASFSIAPCAGLSNSTACACSIRRRASASSAPLLGSAIACSRRSGANPGVVATWDGPVASGTGPGRALSRRPDGEAARWWVPPG